MQGKSLWVQPAITNGIRKGKQTGKCSYYRNILLCFQLDLEKSSNVVLNNFHFCTKEKNSWTWKCKQLIFNLIYPEQGVVG